MNGAQETNLTDWGVFGVALAGMVWFFKKYDPRQVITFVLEPALEKHVGPVSKKVDRIARVIDHMKGSQAAHEAVRIEDDAQKRWEGQ